MVSNMYLLRGLVQFFGTSFRRLVFPGMNSLRSGGRSFMSLFGGRFFKEAIIVAACISAIAGFVLGLMAGLGYLAIPGAGPLVASGVFWIAVAGLVGGLVGGAIFGIFVGFIANSDRFD